MRSWRSIVTTNTWPCRSTFRSSLTAVGLRPESEGAKREVAGALGPFVDGRAVEVRVGRRVDASGNGRQRVVVEVVGLHRIAAEEVLHHVERQPRVVESQ